MKMGSKTDTSAKVDFGWPKWIQKWTKMETEGIQNLCKIASKINAKIDAENVSENEAKINQKWIKNHPKSNLKFDFFAKG